MLFAQEPQLLSHFQWLRVFSAIQLFIKKAILTGLGRIKVY